MSRLRLLASAVLLAPFCLTAAEPAPATVGVTLSGALLELNGAREIPRGLFGVHALPLTSEQAAEWGVESVRLIHQRPEPAPTRIGGADTRAPAGLATVVDCWFDRYQPALPLSDPRGWAERLRELGRAYARAAAARPEAPANLEFWNEPYLNWATKPGVNYSPSLYVTENVRPGDSMVLRATGQPVPGLVWDREIFFVQRPDRTLDYVLSGYLPRDAEPGREAQLGYGAGRALLEDGGTVRLRGREHRLARLWSGRDPDQQFYWSGPVNVRLYNEMLSVLGPAIKETHPAVRLAGGWGFNFFNENWESWHRLIKPTIDANHRWIDALHEHHYGGDTRRVAASYEVAYAYALSHYGRRLAFWNTEAGGYLDPQQPGHARPAAPEDPAARAINSATYLARDVAYLLDRMPDKALHRAAHEPQSTGGDLPALRLLRPLRGRLLAVESSAPGVFAAAAIEGRRLTLLLFNDHPGPREVPLELTAPGGSTFASLVEHRLTTHAERPFLRPDEAARPTGGAIHRATLALPPKSPVILVFTLAAEPVAPRLVRREQHVSREVLLPLVDGPVRVAIPVPPEALAAPGLARGLLRLVVEETSPAYAIELNGHALTPAAGPDSPVWDIPVPREWLAAENRIQITATPARGRLLAAGLWLESHHADPAPTR
jgi:hypothetical protein